MRIRIAACGVLMMALIPGAGFAQTTTDTATDKSQSAQELANLKDAQRTLQYGIVSSVVGVLAEAANNKDKRIMAEAEQLKDSPSADILKALIAYFKAIEDGGLQEGVARRLLNYTSETPANILLLLDYERQSFVTVAPELHATFVELTDNGKQEIVVSAIDTLATRGNQGDIPAFVKLFKKTATTTAVRSALIRFFSKVANDESNKLIRDIARNTDEEKSLRYEALGALGSMKDQEGLNIIRNALLSTDVYERGAAISALSNYPLSDSKPMYLQSLKDDFWRNRVGVLKLISDEKIEGFFDPVSYIAEKDPESTVRQQALQTLAALGGTPTWALFSTIIGDAKKGDQDRIQTLQLAIAGNLSYFHTQIKDLVEKEWKAPPTSALLTAVARSLAGVESADAADLLLRLIQHSDIQIQLSALRGMQKNGIEKFRAQLEAIAATLSAGQLKTAISDSLKK